MRMARNVTSVLPTGAATTGPASSFARNASADEMAAAEAFCRLLLDGPWLKTPAGGVAIDPHHLHGLLLSRFIKTCSLNEEYCKVAVVGSEAESEKLTAAAQLWRGERSFWKFFQLFARTMTRDELEKTALLQPPETEESDLGLVQRLYSANVSGVKKLLALKEWLEWDASLVKDAKHDDTTRTTPAGRDPDWGCRNETHVTTDAAVREQTVLKAAFSLVRRGRVTGAMELFVKHGLAWRAAIMAGGFYHKDVVSGNSRRDIWRGTVAAICDDAFSVSPYEAALYGCLVGRLDKIIPVCANGGWKDVLWAHVCCILDSVVEEMLLYRQVMTVGEMDFNIALALHRAFESVKSSTDAGTDVFFTLIDHFVLGQEHKIALVLERELLTSTQTLSRRQFVRFAFLATLLLMNVRRDLTVPECDRFLDEFALTSVPAATAAELLEFFGSASAKHVALVKLLQKFLKQSTEFTSFVNECRARGICIERPLREAIKLAIQLDIASPEEALRSVATGCPLQHRELVQLATHVVRKSLASTSTDFEMSVRETAKRVLPLLPFDMESTAVQLLLLDTETAPFVRELLGHVQVMRRKPHISHGAHDTHGEWSATDNALVALSRDWLDTLEADREEYFVREEEAGARGRELECIWNRANRCFQLPV